MSVAILYHCFGVYARCLLSDTYSLVTTAFSDRHVNVNRNSHHESMRIFDSDDCHGDQDIGKSTSWLSILTIPSLSTSTLLQGYTNLQVYLPALSIQAFLSGLSASRWSTNIAGQLRAVPGYADNWDLNVGSAHLHLDTVFVLHEMRCDGFSIGWLRNWSCLMSSSAANRKIQRCTNSVGGNLTQTSSDGVTAVTVSELYQIQKRLCRSRPAI